MSIYLSGPLRLHRGNPSSRLCLTAGDDQEETGWKYIHGDVFRFPPYRNVFCAFVGTGSQLLTLSVCIFALVRRHGCDTKILANGPAGKFWQCSFAAGDHHCSLHAEWQPRSAAPAALLARLHAVVATLPSQRSVWDRARTAPILPR